MRGIMVQHDNRFRQPVFQLSIRGLFAVLTAAAVCALVLRQCGWIESLGVGAALVLAGLVIRLRGREHSPMLRVGCGVLAGLILWVVGVDFSRFREGCDYCHSHWDLAEYRVFGCVVHTWKGANHSPTLSRIADDLGAPCPHEVTRWHKWRLWGIVFYASPFHNGTCCISDGGWYDERQRAVVRSLAQQYPDLGPEFRERVLLNRDYAFLQKFYANLAIASQQPPGGPKAIVRRPLALNGDGDSTESN
jgi:hypothetical protein